MGSGLVGTVAGLAQQVKLPPEEPACGGGCGVCSVCVGRAFDALVAVVLRQERELARLRELLRVQPKENR